MVDPIFILVDVVVYLNNLQKRRDATGSLKKLLLLLQEMYNGKSLTRAKTPDYVACL